MAPDLTNPTDHDTLIKIETKLDLLTAAVKDGNDDTKERLTLLGANKVEKDEFHAWQIAHDKENSLREDALKKADRENSDAIKELVDTVTKQGKWITYVAGGLFVFGILLSIVGPVITSALAKLFHIN